MITGSLGMNCLHFFFLSSSDRSMYSKKSYWVSALSEVLSPHPQKPPCVMLTQTTNSWEYSELFRTTIRGDAKEAGCFQSHLQHCIGNAEYGYSQPTCSTNPSDAETDASATASRLNARLLCILSSSLVVSLTLANRKNSSATTIFPSTRSH